MGTTSVMSETIKIPAGEFTMGAVILGGAPQHTVYLDDYAIGRNPVTVAEFRGFANGSGYEFDWSGNEPAWGWQDDHPMVNVSWDDARACCMFMGGDLPTEAQWEKAARGADAREYPWGNDWDPGNCHSSVKDQAFGSAPVGCFPQGASPYGCLDMAGNVWEWCLDWCNPYSSERQENPVGPLIGLYRMLRGGSWCGIDPEGFRCAYRLYFVPTTRLNCIGFRFRGFN